MKVNLFNKPINTFAAALLALLLLAVCTWLEVALKQISGINRPYTIFYLIPVAVGAALLGVWGGVGTALLALALARVYLFADNKHGLDLVSFPSKAEGIEFVAMLLGTLCIAIITGHLRSTLSRFNSTNSELQSVNGELQSVNRRLIESEEQRRVFNRDVLLAVTGGKLQLMEPGEIPPSDLAGLPPSYTQALVTAADASSLRHALVKVAHTTGMDDARIDDLCTATTEAATNAVKHGNGGRATVWSVGDAITVQIADNGSGIAPAHLARATLEQGFSTRVSLGMGFHLMLQSTDMLALCTDVHGTTVFLKVSKRSRPSIQDTVLARYSSL